MNKNELIGLLSKLDIPLNEGISSEKNAGRYPRIVFWDYAWEDVVSSGETYETIETYQISFYAKKPRHEKLLELRDLLRNHGVRPLIQHEYVEDKKIFHSFFSLEVIV